MLYFLSPGGMNFFLHFAGVSKEVQHCLSKLLVILCSVILITNASSANNLPKVPAGSPAQAPLPAPAISDLPLPAKVPLVHRPSHKHFSLHGAPTVAVAPAHSPFYGPLVASGYPPTSSSFSKPSMKRSTLVPPSAGLAGIAPAHFNGGALPAGLGQPPLSPDSSGKLSSK